MRYTNAACIYRFIIFSLSILFVDKAFSQPREPFQPDESTRALYHFESSEPDVQWSTVFEDEERKTSTCALQANDGGWFIAGFSYLHDVTAKDYMLLKISDNGEIQWNRNYGGEEDDECHAILQLENGNILLVGETRNFGNNDNDIWVLITDDNGDSLTSYIYGWDRYTVGINIILEPDGGYSIAGYADVDDEEMILIRIDENGDVLRRNTYPSENGIGDYCNTFIKTTDGGYLLGGYTRVEPENNDRYQGVGTLIKVDANGEQEWIRHYGGEQWGDRISLTDEIYSIVQVENGYVCGGNNESLGDQEWITEEDYWLYEIDENGEVLWSRIYDEFGFAGYDVIRTTDGGYAFTGTNFDFENRTGWKIGFVKVDNEGTPIFSRLLGSHMKRGIGISLGRDGDYVLHGTKNPEDRMSNAQDILIIKTEPDIVPEMDKSGNANHGILLHNAEITDGLWGMGLDLTLDNGGVLLVHDSESLHPEIVALEAWFLMNVEREHSGTIISKQVRDEQFNSFTLQASSESDELMFTISTVLNDYFVYHNVNLSDGEWHHVAGVYNGETMSLHFDGEMVSYREVEGAILYGDGPLLIGADAVLQFPELQFYGKIDEVRVSDIQREYLEIASIYQQVTQNFTLFPAYPNPFNSSTTIEYRVGSNSNSPVTLSLYDLSGRLVQTLVNERLTPGNYRTTLNANGLASGVYVVRLDPPQPPLERGEYSRKVVVVK